MTSMLAAALALVAAIQTQAAAAGTPDLQVTFGHPGRDIQTEGIVVAEQITGDQEPVATGPPGVVGREEVYAIDVTCEAVRSGGTQTESATRAVALAHMVEAACRASSAPPLGLSALLTVQVRGRLQMRNSFSGEGRSTVVGMAVEVTARV